MRDLTAASMQSSRMALNVVYRHESKGTVYIEVTLYVTQQPFPHLNHSFFFAALEPRTGPSGTEVGGPGWKPFNS